MNYPVTKTVRIPARTLKHADAGGRERCIVNESRTFNAIGTGAPHMRVRLSRWTLQGRIPAGLSNFSRFDMKTGKRFPGPLMPRIDGMDILSRGVKD